MQGWICRRRALLAKHPKPAASALRLTKSPFAPPKVAFGRTLPGISFLDSDPPAVREGEVDAGLDV
ncbi:hypothetical protein V7x_31470 [Crateriforma conspicua]|uniref:Uncharacterized protein n=1 Tax=Crateriforma conspicua TaxID=2527996 RepID=A0A5C6G308_9PLAN|nr:hypothetical protein V7x_31470 [Crateriforma conspicua]